MSGRDEQPLTTEYPDCSCSSNRVGGCWQGLELIDVFVERIELYFTPFRLIERNTYRKRVAIYTKENSYGERMATIEELDKVKYIRCCDCFEFLKPEEDEEQYKKYDLIIRIGRREIVRTR